MYRNTTVALLFLFLLSACTKDKKPTAILSKNQMVKVLWEIYLTEEKIGSIGISYDSTIKLFPKFEAKVFEKVGVSDSLFRNSMEYYKANPKELEYIYTALVDSLNLKAQVLGRDTTKRRDELSQ